MCCIFSPFSIPKILFMKFYCNYYIHIYIKSKPRKFKFLTLYWFQIYIYWLCNLFTSKSIWNNFIYLFHRTIFLNISHICSWIIQNVSGHLCGKQISWFQLKPHYIEQEELKEDIYIYIFQNPVYEGGGGGLTYVFPFQDGGHKCTKCWFLQFYSLPLNNVILKHQNLTKHC